MPLFRRTKSRRTRGRRKGRTAKRVRTRRSTGGVGKLRRFWGAFSSKADAERRAKKVGGTIEKRTIRGRVRYVVLTWK